MGSGAFAQPDFSASVLFPRNGTPFFVDLDGDGDADHVSVRFEQGDISISYNDGTETFGPHLLLDEDLPFGNDVFAADADGDGDIDLFAAADKLKWYENDGQSSPGFTTHLIADMVRCARVRVADLDGDGVMEVVTTVFQTLPVQTSGRVLIYSYNSASGTFDTLRHEEVLPPANRAFGLCVTDLHAESVDPEVIVPGALDVLYSQDDRLVALDVRPDPMGGPEPTFVRRVLDDSVAGPGAFYDIDTVEPFGSIAVAAIERREVRFYFRTFSPPEFPLFSVISLPLASTDEPWSVSAVDIDDDGDEDLIVAGRRDGNLLWFEATGGFGSFTRRTLETVPGAEPIRLFVGDLDGDLDADIVYEIANNQQTRLLRNTLFDDPVTNVTVSTGHPTIADALANASGGDVFRVDSSRFAAEPNISSTSSSVGNALLFARRGIVQPPGGLYALDGNDAISTPLPFGPFARYGDLSVPLSTPLPMVLNGDVEVSGGAPNLQGNSVLFNGALSIENGATADVFQLVPDGEICFAGQTLTGESSSLRLLAEGNEAASVVVEGSLTLGERSFTTTDGDLTIERLTAGLSFDPIDITTGADGAYSLTAADMDGDGDLDVIAASDTDESLRWFENDGQAAPAFTARVIDTGTGGADGVVAADFDGDGDADLLTASFFSDSVRWYENDGQSPPVFTARVVTNDSIGPESIAAPDLDGDGDLDVLSASSADNSVRWYENDGQDPPSFSARDIATDAVGTASVFAADMDGDGDTDVLSASSGTVPLRWYENDGQPSPEFTARDVAPGAVPGQRVFAADLDADGDMDVISSSSFDDTVRWHENNGAAVPVFTTRVIDQDAGNVVSFFVTDLDSDGDADFLAAAFFEDSVRWYENDGQSPPVFVPRTITKGAERVRSVFAADIDGDGDTDALSASVFDDAVRWYAGGDSVRVNVLALARLRSLGVTTNRGDLGLGQASFFEALGGFVNEGTASADFATIIADTVNSVGGTLEVPNSLQILGDLTNEGTVRTNGALSVSGLFTNNGVVETSSIARGGSPVTLFAEGGINAGAEATMVLPAGSSVITPGDFELAINDSARLDLSGATVRFNAEEASSFEAMSADIGPSPDGLDRNAPGRFPIGTLRIASGATASLVDARDNDNDAQSMPEAIYVGTLVIEPGATLTTNGIKVYYDTLIDNGTITTPSDVCPIVVNTCLADFDGNGQVDLTDFGAFGMEFGRGLPGGGPGCTAMNPCLADFDGNGQVDLTDFGTFGMEFGRGLPGGGPGCFE